MQLMHGDCLTLMQDIPDNSVDMILCDLPYGTTARNAWDVPIPFETLWEQYHRVTKHNAAILLFSQMPFTADAVASNRKEFRYEWIVQKSQATGFLNAKRMPLKVHENILVFYRKLPTYHPQFSYKEPYGKVRHSGSSTNYREESGAVTINTDGRRYPTDVLKFNFPNTLSRKEGKGLHPTQKPTRLLEYLIKTYTNPGEVVLDNCMGSGSTGVACANTDRDFIGIELNDDYYHLAQKRITDAYEHHQLSFLS